VSFAGYGVDISLIEKPGIRSVHEGRMIFLDEIYSTPLYSLKNPWVVSENTDSFYIQYRSDRETNLELYLGEEIKKSFILPAAEGLIRYQIELMKGDLISGFKIIAVNSENDDNNFKLSGVGIEKSNSGYSVINEGESLVTVISQGFEKPNNYTYLFEHLSARADSKFAQAKISIKYAYSGDGEDNQELVFFSENIRKSFGLNLRYGGAEVHFYSNSLGFIPTGFTVNYSDPDFKIEKVGISSFSSMVPMDYLPVAADIGTMLKYKKEAWRRSDWEIFSWNLFPDILVLDYRDYAIQAASLKRLSFFVEKEGFTGKLLNNKILSGLHGWNAHDYRAEDLAAFFTSVKKENFNLNPEENELRSILLSNNIISENDSGYDPISGGIISYSIESSPRLRRLFISHEAYHGIFFSDSAFVSEVQIIWDNLDEPEKSFWYNFLAWKRYEIDNPYLVLNEFMAYLMQQNIEDVESYYKEYIIPKYLVTFPARSDEINEFLQKYPDHFLDNAIKVEDAAFRLNSIKAGELRCVY
jgi:hypothetical protein